ncbi:hypothetical protein DID88_008571 [Monilinia fructigena]|uniref:Uncharacterized protein n=1 Tax=Monilinia fructigena TaxID=38457 RepID=A0A395J5R2_9HELO|nr:hypothetical protein DID88_008571 [Monilinia fructigena]
MFKTQDLGYVRRTMRNKALKEVEELEKRTVGIKGRGKKVVFVENEVGTARKSGGNESDMDMDIDMDMDFDFEDDEHDEPSKVEDAKEDTAAKNLRKASGKGGG